MPRDPNLKKVLVLGSGPIVIGQAAEFDYSGTQACQALREEGIETVLVNSNPATIMTDRQTADRIYLEPLLAETVESIITRERPDGLLPTLGGQTGLNLAVELAERGVLDKYGVRLLGTPLEAIRKSEDRERFKQTMQELNQPVPESAIVHSVDEALHFAKLIGYPLIIRPAFTLGGSGGGIANHEEELRDIVARGLHESPIHQVLLERSLLGWKEIEFEVLRDRSDQCIAVCSMENVDPVGVHTGDSIVVAPAQTLTDREVHMLREASLTIIRGLGIEGGCNVQLALHPGSLDYYVIEVNPRLSRSSALASKATGYPIASVAAKIAVGLTLEEIANPVTGSAMFEPSLDYVVVKIPRWPFDKFTAADRNLGTQMKATGEVMAIDRSLESALLKAVRSLEIGCNGLWLPELSSATTEELLNRLPRGTDLRLFEIAELLRRGRTVAEISRLTGIDPYFLHKLERILQTEDCVRRSGLQTDVLRRAKRLGISDAQLAVLSGLDEQDVRRMRKESGVLPVYKMVDTCAGEFEARTPYFYSSYDEENEAIPSDKPKVIVLGSGPIRIGQGIEFDYSSVHAVQALQASGYEAIIINNNPETVSTDFNTADRLYFEPLTFEDVLNVIELEKPMGVICQFGGQTAINLAKPLADAGVRILGTAVDDIDRAENREKFDQVLRDLDIPRPGGGAVASLRDAKELAKRIGYPVIVRPSYVLGGRAMEIVHDEDELEQYLDSAVRVSPRHPVWVDRYHPGIEVEVDVISDGRDVLIPGIMEHIERAGVHSGDSVAVYPPISLDQETTEILATYTARLAKALNIVGLCNIQFVVDDRQVLLLEVNPRASRTVPLLTKATGIPIVSLATEVMLGRPLSELGHGTGLAAVSGATAVKFPVFSWSKLTNVDAALGPEMKSTGEVMGISTDFGNAMIKALLGAGFVLPRGSKVLLSVNARDKQEAVPLAKALADLGCSLLATEGTAAALAEAGIPVQLVPKTGEPGGVFDRLDSGEIQLVINTLTQGKQPQREGFRMRRLAVERGIPCITSLDTARILLKLMQKDPSADIRPEALQDLVADRSVLEKGVSQ